MLFFAFSETFPVTFTVFSYFERNSPKKTYRFLQERVYSPYIYEASQSHSQKIISPQLPLCLAPYAIQKNSGTTSEKQQVFPMNEKERVRDYSAP